jgi:hypothetical protein
MDFENEEILEDYIEESGPKPIGVYVKRNNMGKIVEINSEIFIDDLTGWEKIDEGFGDVYAHAQSQYKIKTDSI